MVLIKFSPIFSLNFLICTSTSSKEIKELKKLLDSGIISKTEYNKKAKEQN